MSVSCDETVDPARRRLRRLLEQETSEEVTVVLLAAAQYLTEGKCPVETTAVSGDEHCCFIGFELCQAGLTEQRRRCRSEGDAVVAALTEPVHGGHAEPVVAVVDEGVLSDVHVPLFSVACLSTTVVEGWRRT